MAWSIYADPLLTLPDLTRHCPLKMNRDLELRAVRTWIVLYNLPAFDELKLGIFSDIEGRPGQLLIESSNGHQMDSIQSYDANSSAKEVWFSFEQAPHLMAEGFYHLVLTGSGYNFIQDSFIAWRKAWPDAAYPASDEVFDGRALQRLPYSVALIGREI